MPVVFIGGPGAVPPRLPRFVDLRCVLSSLLPFGLGRASSCPFMGRRRTRRGVLLSELGINIPQDHCHFPHVCLQGRFRKAIPPSLHRKLARSESLDFMMGTLKSVALKLGRLVQDNLDV